MFFTTLPVSQPLTHPVPVTRSAAAADEAVLLAVAAAPPPAPSSPPPLPPVAVHLPPLAPVADVPAPVSVAPSVNSVLNQSSLITQFTLAVQGSPTSQNTQSIQGLCNINTAISDRSGVVPC